MVIIAQAVGAVNVSSIAEYEKLADETEVTFTCKLTVLGHKGRKLFVTDGKRGAMLYGVFSKTYSFGDVFREGLSATKATLDMAPELIKVNETTLKVVATGTDVTPEKMNIEDIGVHDVYKYVSVTGYFNGETGTLKSGKNKLLLMNIFGAQMPTTNGRESIKGVLVYHMKREVMQVFVL